MSGNRVGDPNALIKPGDPVPGKPGSYYEVGQFSPSIETLSVMKLLEAQTAGVLPSKYDVYNDAGQVDQNKLKKINFVEEAQNDYGIQLPGGTPPGVSLMVLATLDILPKAALRYPRVEQIVFDINTAQVMQTEMEAQRSQGTLDPQQQGEGSAAISTALTGFDFKLKPYTTVLHIYQPFYTYLSVPLIPAVANLTSGLSVASYSLLNTVAKAIYNRLLLGHESLAYRFLELTGWQEEDHIQDLDRPHFKRGGEEIGVTRVTQWYRDTRKPSVSQLSTVSPLEAFAEGYIHYYLHRKFMNHVAPDLIDFYQELHHVIEDRVSRGIY